MLGSRRSTPAAGRDRGGVDRRGAESEIHAAREAGLPLVVASEEPVSTELHDSTADVEDALGPTPAAEPEPVAPPVSEMVEVDEAPEPEPEADVEPEPETELKDGPLLEDQAEPSDSPATESADTDVNALFARLRAEREAAAPEPAPRPRPTSSSSTSSNR